MNATGLVTANAPGFATITATSEGKSGSATVDVSGPTAFVSGRVINYVTGQGIGGAAVSFRSNDAVGSTPHRGYDRRRGWKLHVSWILDRNLDRRAGRSECERLRDRPDSGRQRSGRGDHLRRRRSAGAQQRDDGRHLRSRQECPHRRRGLRRHGFAVQQRQLQRAVATQTSNGSGAFTFTSLPAGTYRLTASATGFQDAQRVGVAVGDGGVTANQDLVLSPSGTNAITIVLTWGASPSDLDSHLTGPNPDGSRFHVYYSSRGSLTSAPFANLDVDDVTSFGPETITITQMSAGTYRYSVHDFSNRNSNPSSGLGSSGAKVQVYTAAGLAQTFSVPGQAGTLWTVFELSGTLASPVITAKNIMSYVSEPGAITAPPMVSGFGVTDGSLIGSAVRQHPKNPR